VMVELTPAGQRALKEPSPLRTLAAELAPAEPSAETTGTKARAVPTDAAALADNDPLLLRLRAWRLERAREEKVAAFIIAHDALLRNVAAARPQSEDELLAVKGMGPAKMEKYGTELLALVRGENRQVKAVEPQTKP